MSELDQLRQEAEQLKNQIRVSKLCVRACMIINNNKLNDKNVIAFKWHTKI